MSKFVHLHVHSEYSLLDGLSKIPKLVTQAKIMGMDSLAITDHGTLYGAIKFYKECKKEGINPIIGCEMYIAKRSMHDKEAGRDNENFHLTVLAQDYEGYKNLMQLITLAHLEGFYYRPRVDKETLTKFAKGLIALSGCSSSETAKALIEGKIGEAERITRSYVEIFGRENFYLEVQKHLFGQFATAHDTGSEIHADLIRMASDEKKIIEGIKKLSKTLNLKITATNDVHYVQPSDAQAQDAIVCIQTGKNISDIKRLRMIDSPTYYLKNSEEMQELFGDMPQLIENSAKIAEKVDIKITLGKVAFPHYEVPQDQIPDEYLKKLAYAGMDKRIDKVTDEIRKRLDYELSIISKKGYSTYFLVVADFVNWSRSKGIISTTRGSVSGSLVSYAIGITNVNPLDFKLPFERFLNLYRPTLPDIDVDFEDNRRDEVIHYVRQKYGHEKVAQIGTFGTMMARAAVRDVARVLGWPYIKADRIAKMVPIGFQGFHMSLDTAKKQNKELGNLYESDREVRELLDLAQKVEGNARHVSVHAAGVVIGPSNLINFTPLQKETTGAKIITQYDMYDVEEIGLVKMDFLGIRNLSILGEAVKIVFQNKKIKIDLNKIELDDKKAFEILARGETMGLFQLGGSGMTRYLKELKPTNIFDIMAMISLFRPGPMNSIPEFIDRKNNSKKIQYFDPRMEKYLDQSYGVIVYQDDVLLTAINIAGYNWEEADNFRKAMGKKIPAEMTRQKEKFINGCVKNGMTSARAEELFKLIEPFAAYGFNKAHAASYAIIAYQTAYMKANFPVEFMAAVMTAEADDPDKIAAAVEECAKMAILVLPPDINESNTGFAIQDVKREDKQFAVTSGVKYKSQAVRFGFSAIKNVGKVALEAIISQRNEHGPFRSLDDFVKRVNLRVVNRKTMESLIKAGAMDKFGRRNAMLKVLEDIKASGASLAKTIATGQGSLFDTSQLEENSKSSSISYVLDSTEEASREEILSWERELLGFYLTENPLTKVSEKIEKIATVKISEIDIINPSSNQIKVGGIIVSIRKTLTKIRKEEMCFLKLQDISGIIDILVFPRVYSQVKGILSADQIIVVWGKLEIGEETPILIAEKISLLEKELERQETESEIFEVVIPRTADRTLLSKVYEALKSSPGDISTCLVLPGNESASRKIPIPFGIQKTSELARKLENLGCHIGS
ncbi:DNA polymerase III subunit alpha [Candidatus Curtissbacteria bacterium RIFCSPHIGHO2_01_FULL_41_13]|uniref:DNA polymerase III subunit alpha n=1 Tax=Candidatus Curtissbacteria bacterium RIFCSPHIGHO2_01_FULL_41_13 TaxID=1797745 RepID=A0A1F5G138_9BACT|nr:MAG: DNA polymerase III subunit alpha [Candidatus Curtissbacteria bacterium RIFCSPHIGHO2_01_FULL_41_13]